MKTINDYVLVRLLPRKQIYGVKLRSDSNIKELTTKRGIAIVSGNEYSPDIYVPTQGIVEVSNMPGVVKGDMVHMEYYGVIRSLGKWWDPACEVDDPKFILRPGKKGSKICSVFVKSEYLYYIEHNDGKLTMLNNYNVITPIYLEKQITIIVPTAKTNFADCIAGEYAGKTIIFHANSDMCNTAHARTVVQSKWVEGTLEHGKIIPTADRVSIIPDKPKAFNEHGLIIPVEHRKLPTRGTIEYVGSSVTSMAPGDTVYFFNNTTTVVTTMTGIRLLVRADRVPLKIKI